MDDPLTHHIQGPTATPRSRSDSVRPGLPEPACDAEVSTRSGPPNGTPCVSAATDCEVGSRMGVLVPSAVMVVLLAILFAAWNQGFSWVFGEGREFLLAILAGPFSPGIYWAGSVEDVVGIGVMVGMILAHPLYPSKFTAHLTVFGSLFWLLTGLGGAT